MADLSGRELGGCRLIRPIGAGGMGEVYLGEQIRLGNRQVAVKLVRLDAEAYTPEMLRGVENQFTHEGAVLASFSHPNILQVYDAGIEDGELYLVMEYVPGGSLADAIRPGPSQKFAMPMDATLAITLIGQVASALQYAHDHAFVHRDVKPGNILLRQLDTGAWQALLADFGVAKAMHSASQRTQVTGTLTYMAPEQFTGAFSPASDQYALGVVTYLLLTGRPPFEGDLATLTQAHLNEPPPSLRTLNPAISPALDAVVLRALAKQPGDRYPRVADFASALRAANVPGASVAAAAADKRASAAPSKSATNAAVPQWPLPGAPSGPREHKPGLGRPWVLVMAAVLLLVAALGGTALLRQRQQQVSAQATQTALAAGPQQTSASQTALANATATAVAQIGATTTANASIPTATATASIGTDVTSPPPPPSQAGSIVFADTSPTCVPGGPIWDLSSTNLKTPTCPSGGGVEVQVQSAGLTTLACIYQAASTLPNDFYLSTLVTPKGGPIVLSFRSPIEPQGTPPPGADSTHTVPGYLFAVDSSNAGFQLNRSDPNRVVVLLRYAALPEKPAADFALGVLAQGPQITLYLNGVQIGQVSDGTYASGGFGLCTQGDAIFRDVQDYSLKS